MPNKVTMTLTVEPQDGGVCIEEEQAYMTKGTSSKPPCNDPNNKPHKRDERELEIVVDDKTNANTAVFLDILHGKPACYFENPPPFPLKVTPSQSQTLMLRQDMGLATRDPSEPCFYNECSPYAQLIQFSHKDAKGNEIEHCRAMQHTYVHVEL